MNDHSGMNDDKGKPAAESVHQPDNAASDETGVDMTDIADEAPTDEAPQDKAPQGEMDHAACAGTADETGSAATGDAGKATTHDTGGSLTGEAEDDAGEQRSRLRVLLGYLAWIIVVAAGIALLAAMAGIWVGERPTLMSLEQALLSL